jgi:hypothetical protein
MTSAMTAFGIAAGGTSPICHVSMTRPLGRRADRGLSRDGAGSAGGIAGGDGGEAAAN